MSSSEEVYTMTNIKKVFSNVHQKHRDKLDMEISSYHCRFTTKSREYVYAEIMMIDGDEPPVYIIDSTEEEDYDFIYLDSLEEELTKRVRSILFIESIKEEDKYCIL